MSCLLNSQSISMPEFTSSKRAMHSTSEFIRVELDRLLFTIEQRIVIERMRLGSCAEDVFASVDAADRLRRLTAKRDDLRRRMQMLKSAPSPQGDLPSCSEALDDPLTNS